VPRAPTPPLGWDPGDVAARVEFLEKRDAQMHGTEGNPGQWHEVHMRVGKLWELRTQALLLVTLAGLLAGALAVVVEHVGR
jgi:hypothetical protein